MRIGGWILFAAAAAVALIAVATDPYPGVTVDSAEYLAVARSLGQGRGLTMPFISYDEAFRVLAPGERVDMTQFPPLYPVVLALVHTVADLSLLDVVRITGAASFGALMASVTTMVMSRTGSLLAGLAAGALLLAPDLLTVHAMAWSETIMIVTVVLALHYGARHLRDSGRRSLILAGVFGAVASMARFAGVAALVTIAAALLLDRQRPATRRLRDAALFLALTLVPTAAWFLRNTLVAGYASEKRLGWHPPGADHLLQAVQAIGSWIVPGKGAALVAGGVALLAGAIATWRRRDRLPALSTLPGLSLAFGAVYLAFMLATKTFLDQNISLDGRILAPLHVALLIALCSMAPPSSLRTLSRVAIALIVVVTLGRGLHAAATFSSSGTASYTNERWRNSQTLAFTGALPEDALIVTNAPDPIWLWHGHNPQIFPPVVDLYTGLPNTEHDAQVAELKRAAACRNTYVVFFAQPTRKPPREIPGTLVQELDLQLEREMEDGSAYRIGDLPPC